MATTTQNLTLVEIVGLAPAIVVADAVAKAAQVDLIGIEGDAGRQCLLKFTGTAADCTIAADTARATAAQMQAQCVVRRRLAFAEPDGLPLVKPTEEYSAIAESHLQIFPRHEENTGKERDMKALGILETQGLTGAIEGADAMVKAADVEILGKEKIGAAHVTIMVEGDVAAVNAAVEAGRAAAEEVGTLVAAHVIARPHEALARLLPR